MSPTAISAEYCELSLDQVVESTWNPRKHFDELALAELAQSIAEKGVIEPIVVRPIANPPKTGPVAFEIVAGARRFRASRKAGLARIPSIVRQLDDAAALELAVIENGQREDIHPLDEAAGFEALMDFDAKAYSVPVVAAKVGKSESYVYRRLKLLQLIPPVRRAFEADALTVAHAERMARLSPALQQDAYESVLFSPLFRFGQADEDDTKGEKDRVPSRDGLEPLGRLDQFIQEHTAVDPDHEDTKQYFPELEEQIQEAIESEAPEQADGSKPATLLKGTTYLTPS